MGQGGQGAKLRAGDHAEVRSAREILATLDEDGTLDAVPFMPEMLPYIGQRFPVHKRLETICDYFSGGPSRSRFLPDAVLLGDLRCDGSSHDDCKARCRFFWKEQWLRGTDAPAPSEDPVAEAAALAELARRAENGKRVTRIVENDEEEVWRCQITEAIRASRPVAQADPRRFARELTSRNTGLLHFARVAFRAVTERVGRKLRLVDELPVKVAGEDRVNGEVLHLQAGDLVEVRSRDEIGKTLDENGRLKGLAYSAEMNPACGRRFRVLDRIDRMIDERTGRMIEFKTDCVILENFVCMGDHSRGAWFCAREHYPYWREAWLKRVEEPGATDSVSA